MVFGPWDGMWAGGLSFVFFLQEEKVEGASDSGLGSILAVWSFVSPPPPLGIKREGESGRSCPPPCRRSHGTIDAQGRLAKGVEISD